MKRYDGTDASARALGLVTPGQVAEEAWRRHAALTEPMRWTEVAHAVKRHVLAHHEVEHSRRCLVAHLKALSRNFAHFGGDEWGPHQYTSAAVHQAAVAAMERAARVAYEHGATTTANALRREARAMKGQR